jgi:SAM-dependent methyltransferase
MNYFYNKELSDIHDQYFGSLAFNAAQEVLKILENSGSAQKITDLGCGSGILAKILTDKGYDVLGVDISAPMLEIARANAPKATFRQSSLFNFEFTEADFICAIGEPINYLADKQSSPEAIGRLFNKIYDCLSPNGYFLFDVLTTEAPNTPTTKMVENDNMTMFVEITTDTGSSILERKMTFFTKENGHYKKNKESHKQRLYNREDIMGLLAKTGFAVKEITDYNGLKFRKGHFAYFCKKNAPIR